MSDVAIDRRSTQYKIWLQRGLNRLLGTNLETDGIVGPLTKTAIAQLQRQLGRPATGIARYPVEHAITQRTEQAPPGVYGPSPGTSGALLGTPDLSSLRTNPPTVLDRFEFGQANIVPEHTPIIERLAAQIVASFSAPDPIHLVSLGGHTDSIGDTQSNLRLGQQRAQSVTEALQARLRALDPSLVARIGWWPFSGGEQQPTEPGTTPDARARNRRVEVFFDRRWRVPPPVPNTVPPTPRPNTKTGKLRLRLVAVHPPRSKPDEEAFEAAEAEDYAAEANGRSIPPAMLPRGQAATMSATISDPPDGQLTFTWTSLDPTVVTPLVDRRRRHDNPNRMRFLGHLPGRAKIRVTVRFPDGSKSSSVSEVVVTEAEFTFVNRPTARLASTGELVVTRGPRAEQLAHAELAVQFRPVSFWAGRTIDWQAKSVGQTRGTSIPFSEQFAALEGHDFDPAKERSVLDAQGSAAVRVNLALAPFNRLQVECIPPASPRSGPPPSTVLIVPGAVVIDPGHGSMGPFAKPKPLPAKVGGSSWNNAQGPTTKVLEKDLTLDVSLRLQRILESSGRAIQVFMTRTTDVNRGLASRANVARDNLADVLLSIHFNGSSNSRQRGSSTFFRVKSKTVSPKSHAASKAFATRVQRECVAFLKQADLGVFPDTVSGPKALGVLNELQLGNTKDFHPTRACLAEADFLSSKDADVFFNDPPPDGNEDNRQGLAEAFARAIIEDLENQPS